MYTTHDEVYANIYAKSKEKAQKFAPLVKTFEMRYRLSPAIRSMLASSLSSATVP